MAIRLKTVWIVDAESVLLFENSMSTANCFLKENEENNFDMVILYGP